MADLKRWSRGEISRMRSEMDKLFDELCSDFDLPVMFCRIAGDLDLREEGDVLIARLEMGHMNPEDVHVAVHDRRLIISADYVETRDNVQSSRIFHKELRLPCIIRTDEVEANFKDGVLTVCLPKCVSQLGQRIDITRK